MPPHLIQGIVARFEGIGGTFLRICFEGSMLRCYRLLWRPVVLFWPETGRMKRFMDNRECDTLESNETMIGIIPKYEVSGL